MPDPLIRTLALDTLELSSTNVRKTAASDAAAAELEASISAHGLLENLLVRPLGTDTDTVQRYAVIAGARRLSALQRLARDGVLAPDHPVPCRLIDEDADERELSLVENVVREPMHVADQVEAFAVLAEAGMTRAAIATRFGVSERTVEQRLRLGSAAPSLLDAYRDEQISLDTLMAFTLTSDPEHQLAVWALFEGQRHRPSAWDIRRLLTEERVQGNQGISRFVGLEAYEAAGGAYSRDLFAEDDGSDVWFDDPALLHTLATEKLEAAAAELRTEWAWVEPRLDVDWNTTAHYANVYPEPGSPTDEERGELERLNTRRAELDNLDDDDWTDALSAEAGAIEQRLDELDDLLDARAAYRPEHKAIAGCIVTIAHHGALRVIDGLVRPDDARALADDDEDNTVRAPLAAPTDPARKARERAGVGAGLADDLRAIRTGDVKAHLSRDFEAAFDLLLFQLARGVFRGGYHAGALDIGVHETIERPTVRGNDTPFPELDAREAALSAERTHLNLGWLHAADDGDAFERLCALSDAEKQCLFAACVARTVKGQLAFEHGARPELEHTIARLDIDFAARFRPNAELFWKRVVKNRILAIARQTLGEAWAQAHARFKKAELADAMEEAFAAGDGAPAGVTAEARMTALAWTPPGFRAFDERGIDLDGQPDAAEQPDPTAAEEPLKNVPEDPAPEHVDGDPSPADVTAGDDAAVVAVRTDTHEAPVVPTEETPPARADYDSVRITIANGGRDVTAERERVLAPPRGNGQAREFGTGDPLEIPAFLRRTP